MKLAQKWSQFDAVIETWGLASNLTGPRRQVPNSFFLHPFPLMSNVQRQQNVMSWNVTWPKVIGAGEAAVQVRVRLWRWWTVRKKPFCQFFHQNFYFLLLKKFCTVAGRKIESDRTTCCRLKPFFIATDFLVHLYVKNNQDKAKSLRLVTTSKRLSFWYNLQLDFAINVIY